MCVIIECKHLSSLYSSYSPDECMMYVWFEREIERQAEEDVK